MQSQQRILKQVGETLNLLGLLIEQLASAITTEMTDDEYRHANRQTDRPAPSRSGSQPVRQFAAGLAGDGESESRRFTNGTAPRTNGTAEAPRRIQMEHRDRPPQNGRELYAHLKKRDDANGTTMVKRAAEIGKANGLPGKMVAWNGEEAQMVLAVIAEES